MNEEKRSKMPARLYAPLSLAYLGDAVYELMIREDLVTKRDLSPQKYHKASVRLANAKTQAKIVTEHPDFFTEEEKDILKRGKNAKPGTLPKSCTPQEYHLATGLECLFGYLYLEKRTERLEELFELCLATVKDAEKEK
ncbi:MAG: ribonuclease III [Lachnospiraceae bacterium]|nr:ribonuclease III [Lachnospiraceae bacterium]